VRSLKGCPKQSRFFSLFIPASEMKIAEVMKLQNVISDTVIASEAKQSRKGGMAVTVRTEIASSAFGFLAMTELL
jgi:hypothetical protein